MQISDNGIQQIIQREGVMLHAYQDSVGVWTIGTGHTSAAGPPRVTHGMTITRVQNNQILRNDLVPIEAQAAQNITVPITQNQYDAIISIVFNVGPKFWHSTCIQELNSGNVQSAANAIMQWSKPPEIIGRRRTEQKQFLTPDTVEPTPSTPVEIPSLPDINTQVTSASSIFETIKKFSKENVTTNVPVIAGGVSAMFTNNWPFILAGVVGIALITWLIIHYFKKGI